MKSNKPSRPIGTLANQEVNTEQVKGGKGIILMERVQTVKSAPDPDCVLPGPDQKVVSVNHQKKF